MADEQYTWLDRATAEALLRGESLEAVDAAARDQAERLAKTLEALTAEPPPTGAELPGEAAALAAFRAAREDAPAERSDAGHRAGAHASDAGLVRIGGPVPDGRRARRGRSARFVLTAVLAAGMVGGVAYAVTSGVLPTPFGGDPGPAASVTAPATPSPLVSSSPHGLAGKPSPDGSTGGGPATPGNTPGHRPSATPGAEDGGWWRRQAPSACRDALRGRELTGDRRQALENAAGGYSPDRVLKYCRNVLAGTPGAFGDGKGHGGGKDDGGNGGKGNGKGKGKGGSGNGNGNGHGGRGNQNGGGKGGDDDGHIGPGGNGPGGGRKGDDTATSATPALPGHLLTTRAPTPSPEPSYTALNLPNQP
ncbi:hypothetical protein ACQF4J_18995 [Streptomyces sp. C1-1]|uniref:hypothetical protein n=1 Tax=Streptomyces sp. C1-1 TaxID=3231173 RepID=UPI003D065864